MKKINLMYTINMEVKMEKQDVILLCLSTDEEFTPVQIQKLLFLIDKKVSKKLGGPFFNFIPYDYGPFDIEIYQILENLEKTGYIIIDLSYRFKKYRITKKGQKKVDEFLNNLDKNIKEYIFTLSEFVRNLSFSELISAIYKAFPDMKINSIFRE